MLTVKPFVDDNHVTLICEDENKLKGYIKFYLDSYIINIDEILVIDDDKMILELLIKSLGQYAMNHKCFYIYNQNDMYYDVLKSFGFILEENKQIITLDKLFNHTCDGGN